MKKAVTHLKRGDALRFRMVTDCRHSRLFAALFRRIDSSKTYRRFRRKCISEMENSFLLSLLRTLLDRLLSVRIGVYGVFLMSASLIVSGIHALQVWGFRSSEMELSRLLFCGGCFLSSLPLLFAGKDPLRRGLRESRVFGFILYDLLGLYPEDAPTANALGGSAFAFLAGVFVGLLSIWVTPWQMLASLLAVVATVLIFIHPEAGLSMLVILLPIPFDKTIPLIAIGCMTPVAYLAKWIRGKRSIRFGLPEAGLLILALFILGGTLLPVSDSAVFAEGLLLLSLPLIAILSMQMTRDCGKMLCLSRSIALSAIAAALCGIGKWGGEWIPRLLAGEKITVFDISFDAGFLSPSSCGCYLMLALVFSLVASTADRRHGRYRLYMLPGLLLCGGGILLTMDPAIILGGVAALAAYLFLRRKKVPAVLLLLLTAAFAVLLPLGPNELTARLFGQLPERLATAIQRLRVCLPCLPIGAGSGASAPFGIYRASADAAATVPSSGSFYLQVLCENGIFGLLFLLFTVACVLSLALFAIRLVGSFSCDPTDITADKHDMIEHGICQSRLLSAGCASLIGLLCGGILTDPFADPATAILFFILLGATAGIARASVAEYAPMLLSEGEYLSICRKAGRKKRKEEGNHDDRGKEAK